MVIMVSATPRTGPQDFNEGPSAAERFRNLIRDILSTRKADVVKQEPHTKKQHTTKKK
jgi:hypothetical protein